MVAGNLLNANAEGIETNVSEWAADTNCTVSRITSQFYEGAACLELNASASGVFQAATVNLVAVTASTSYDISAAVKSAATVRSTKVRAQWFDSGFSPISISDGTAANDATGAWTLLAATSVTSPSNAAYVKMYVWVTTGVLNEKHWFDRIAIVPTPSVGQPTLSRSSHVPFMGVGQTALHRRY